MAREPCVNGHVTVHQGERLMKSDDAEYESAGNQCAVQGKVDYEDPLIHVTGNKVALLHDRGRQLQ
jgi:lipopolysaccharide assembly outer membrane protein LptD (OstA)